MKHLRYDPLNIVICGIGGQGNVLASEVLSSTMSEMGYHVAVGETYGAAQRGGSVMSHVRISETEELGVLISSGEAQIIIGFEPLETLRMARRYAGPDSLIIYDPRPVYPLGVLQGEQRYPDLEALRSEIRSLAAQAYEVPAADIAMGVGDSRAANIVLLGAFSQLPGAPLTREDLSAVLAQRFRGAVLELNRKAFDLGCAAVDKKGSEA
jgi:indolepyruvate ferredoxin oxidoreductase, beta subunit